MTSNKILVKKLDNNSGKDKNLRTQAVIVLQIELLILIDSLGSCGKEYVCSLLEKVQGAKAS